MRFLPMEPVLWREAFNDPAFAFQVKWDGLRCLAEVFENRVRLFGRRGQEWTGRFPELAGIAGQVAGDAVLDGELVVLEQGKPSFPAALRRLAGRVHPPIHYFVFDLLHWRGADLIRSPWSQRQECLAQAVRPGKTLHRVGMWSGERGQELFRRCAAAGLEGVVAKELRAPYRPGRRDDSWRKVKAWREVLAVVGGYLTTAQSSPASLVLGAYAGRELWYIGRVGSGLGEAERALLREFLFSARRASPPFKNAPKLPGVAWVEPELVARVRFLEWTPGALLRAPVLIGFPPAEPASCQI